MVYSTTNRKVNLTLLVLIIFLISIISYHTYIENGWYVMDDYITLEKGTTGSIFESSQAITSWLHSSQGRYQPVRLFILTVLTRIFQEEYSPYYNFGLHLINLVLLFLLLRKFNVTHVSILITVLLFSLFGRYRMMESPNVMIGGSGLNLSFILLTLLFLIKSFEVSTKKIVCLVISWVAYTCLIFSYEVAFPLFLPIVYVFFIFHLKDISRNSFRLKKYLYLFPYLISPLIYLILFKVSTQSSYEGSTIKLSSEILTRLRAYIDYTMHFPIKFTIGTKGVSVLLLYFTAVIISLKIDRLDTTSSNQIQNNLKVLIFGIIFYFSSMVLFTLTKLGIPSSIMRHHTYLMTAGSSILMVFALFSMHFIFKGSIKKAYQYFLIIFFFPVFLVSGLNFNLKHYKEEFERTNSIKLIKYKIQASIKEAGEIDAIIVKNFFQPYYNISGMSGAFLQWFNFKKYIHAGREIISVKDNNIKFRGPLTYYHSPNQEYEVQNKRTEIFYLNEEDKNLLSYHDVINFDEGENIHQTLQVRGDSSSQCDSDYILDAILKNEDKDNFLAIIFNSTHDLDIFLKKVVLFDLNGAVAKTVFVSKNSIFIDAGKSRDNVKYLLLRIVSTDKKFKGYLKSISLSRLNGDFRFSRYNLKNSSDFLGENLFYGFPVIWDWKEGFYGLEGDSKNNWRWGSSHGELFVTNTSPKELQVTLEMKLGTAHNEFSNLKVKSTLFNEDLKINSDAKLYLKKITIPPGKHVIRFESDAKKPNNSVDPRLLSFIISNFRVADCVSSNFADKGTLN